MSNHADLKAAGQAGITARDRNREIALRYRDIAAKLCEPPLKLARPDQWGGFIPGPLEQEGPGGLSRRNASPVRAQLLAIVMEAAERADAEQASASVSVPRWAEYASAGVE